MPVSGHFARDVACTNYSNDRHEDDSAEEKLRTYCHSEDETSMEQRVGLDIQVDVLFKVRRMQA